MKIQPRPHALCSRRKPLLMIYHHGLRGRLGQRGKGVDVGGILLLNRCVRTRLRVLDVGEAEEGALSHA